MSDIPGLDETINHDVAYNTAQRGTEARPAYEALSLQDALALSKARKNYGESWCKRGGIGAFMMLARKFDRMAVFAKKHNTTALNSLIAIDTRPEGIIDDIRDLRRYLLLVEAKCVEQGVEGNSWRRHQAADEIPPFKFDAWWYTWQSLENLCEDMGYDIFLAMDTIHGMCFVQDLRVALAQAEIDGPEIKEVVK